jgi:diguanylate cyclase (GGDEF)-like protein/PAS domain S-box-containing protein
MDEYNYDKIISGLDVLHKSGYMVFEDLENIQITFVSKYINNVFGYDIENTAEYMNNNIMNIIHNDDVDIFLKAITNSFKSGKEMDVLIRIYTNRGQLNWLKFKGVTVNSKHLLVVSVVNITKEKQREEELTVAKKSLNKIIEKSNMYYWEYDFKLNMIFYGDNIKYAFGMPGFYYNFPYNIKDSDFFYEDDKDKFINAFLGIKNHSNNDFELDYRIVVNNKIIHVHDSCITIYDTFDNPIKAVGLTRNIDDLKKLESKNKLFDIMYILLKDITSNKYSPEEIYQKILEGAVDTVEHSTKGSILINRGDDKFVFGALSGYDKSEFVDFLFDIKETTVYIETNGKLDRPIIINDILDYDKSQIRNSRIESLMKQNSLRVLTTLSIPIMHDDKMIAIINLDSMLEDAFDTLDVKQLEMFGFEISNFFKLSKLLENQEYNINHDTLTNVHSRTYFYSKLDKFFKDKFLPLSIASLDINGLKLVNDTFGHQSGNKLLIRTAELITNAIGKNGIVARLGGDEFSILLPCTNAEDAENILASIKNKLADEKIRDLDISVSYGVSTIYSNESDIESSLIEADSRMYLQKNQNRENDRTKAISSILQNLFKLIPIEKKHAYKVSEYSKIIGKEYGLKDFQCEELGIIGHLHDIGKIAITPDVMNKQVKVSDEDMDKIKGHCATGYVILNTAVCYLHTSNIVLNHHENYDGSGYPKGKKGSDIPIMSRILRVADSIAAMSTNRTYAKAYDVKHIIKELSNNSGTQFDPEVVRVAIKYLKREGLLEYIEN